MKKKIIILVAILTLIFTVNAFAGTVNISIDGVNVEFTENSGAPFIDDSYRTQVPLRATMEAFGATVDWDQKNYIAIVEKDGIKVEVPIWQSYIYKNGEIVFNDTFAMIMDNRTYLPIRAVLEAFGAKVDWDNDSKTVVVIKDDCSKEEVKENRYFRDSFSKFAEAVTFSPREIYYNDDGTLSVSLYIYNGREYKVSDLQDIKITIKYSSSGEIIASKNISEIKGIDLNSGEHIIKIFTFSKTEVFIDNAELVYIGLSTSSSHKK